MAEALGLAVNITTLLTTAFSISRAVYTLIDQISNAPKHIRAIASDLEDFYSILGTLKGYLENQEMSEGVVHAAQTINLSRVLESSVGNFSRINLLVNSNN